MSQHEQFDVLGGGRAAQQHDQSEHVLDQVQAVAATRRRSCRVPAITNHRWSAPCAAFWNPTGQFGNVTSSSRVFVPNADASGRLGTSRVVMSLLTCACVPSSCGLCRACVRCSLRICSEISALGTRVGAEEAGVRLDLIGGSY
jgi:hypothetical protein